METDIAMNLSEAEIDNALLNALEAAEDGIQKNASAQGTRVIRRRIRESGFQRLIMEYEPISNDQLTYLPNTELAAKVEEMEPDSPGAKACTFNDGPDTQFYRGDKFIVVFCKITTPMFTKNIEELRTYKSNLRQMITDNALRDIHTTEDGRFISLVDRMCGTKDTADGEAGVCQFKGVTGGVDRGGLVEATDDLEDRDIENGTFLVNRKTAKWVATLDRNTAGGDLAERTLTEGTKALGKLQFAGVPYVATIKRDLVPANFIYQFADPAFLGRAYMLQDIRLWVEKKLDILRFCAFEKVGLTIANVGAVNITEFEPTSSDYGYGD
jgi:hypothetical protein